MNNNIKEINAGGVNGTGTGIVNTNSKDYKGLQNIIREHAEKQTFREKVDYELVSLKFQMESYLEKEKPSEIIRAGDFLRRHLSVTKIKNKEFAKYIELEGSNLSAILKGRRKINIELAFKLGQIFNLNPNIWLLIQSENELNGIDKEKQMKYKKYRLEDLLEKVD